MNLLIVPSIILKRQCEKFLRLFLANPLIREGRPSRFIKKNLESPYTPTKGQFYAVLDKNGRLRKPENHSREETRLVIRPFTVKVTCRIRGLASIRKGLGKENTPFLVSSNSMTASENVSGENFESI